MQMANDNRIKLILRDTAILYMVSAVAIMIIKIFMAYLNGEEIIETFAIAFRSYVLGSRTSEETILYMRMEDIGIFFVLFSLFFALEFCYLTSNLQISKAQKIVISILAIFIGSMLLLIKSRFILCIPESILVFGVFLLLSEFIRVPSKLPLLLAYRVGIAVTAVTGIIMVIAPYFIDM